MSRVFSARAVLALGTAAFLLAACGGGGGGGALAVPTATKYQVSGSLTGLTSGASVVLAVNGQSLTVSQNGGFDTPVSLGAGSAYSLTVAAPPAGEACSVTNGSGTVDSSNVTDVLVACTTHPTVTYTVGGTVSGLNGSLALLDNGGDKVTLTGNGGGTPVGFLFAAALYDQASYDVTVGTQPAGQTCGVANAAGTVQGAKITNVQVTCANNPSAAITVGGNLSGLATGSGLILQDNGADDLTVTANGAFTFHTPVASGSPYTVTLAAQPANQTCSVANGTSTAGGSNVTNVQVTCAASSYAIGGTLTGLASGASVVLQDNGGDNLTLTAGGTFVFSQDIAIGSAYQVTVLTQASGQMCSVANGSGVSSPTATPVQVTCASPTESFLYSFGGSGDASTSYAGLVMDSHGNLYGTTIAGGTNGTGAVFRLSPNGLGGYTETVLYSFGTATSGDGNVPYAGLILDAQGNLYGTTTIGGANNTGTVFRISPNGLGGYVETVLYSFGGASSGDGVGPVSLMQDSQGNLYGTTVNGGANNTGTVFRLSPNGLGGYAEAVLYSFGATSGGDGNSPWKDGNLIEDAQGDLYGTTLAGGANGTGTVFRLAPNGNGGYVESLLHSFGANGSGDGNAPNAGLTVDGQGNLVGTTQNGGRYGVGTVFRISESGTGYAVLNSFGATSGDAKAPRGSVIFDAQGNLYGTTEAGGAAGTYGTVFRLSPNGFGNGYTESVLYSFGNNVPDGYNPYGGVVLDAYGNLYGTTKTGASAAGAVFKIAP